MPGVPSYKSDFLLALLLKGDCYFLLKLIELKVKLAMAHDTGPGLS